MQMSYLDPMLMLYKAIIMVECCCEEALKMRTIWRIMRSMYKMELHSLERELPRRTTISDSFIGLSFHEADHSIESFSVEDKDNLTVRK